MPTTLTADAVEKSTYAIVVSFFDEAGVAVTPNAGLNWTLTDEQGTVVNSRSAVSIPIPGTTVTIVLHGADLAVSGNPPSEPRRVVSVQGTYNSATLGSNLEIKDQVMFVVQNLIGVS